MMDKTKTTDASEPKLEYKTVRLIAKTPAMSMLLGELLPFKTLGPLTHIKIYESSINHYMKIIINHVYDNITTEWD